MRTEKSYIWLNGNVTNLSGMKNFCDGLRHKSSVFEKINIYNEKIFQFKAHIDRFFYHRNHL